MRAIHANVNVNEITQVRVSRKVTAAQSGIRRSWEVGVAECVLRFCSGRGGIVMRLSWAEGTRKGQDAKAMEGGE